MLDLNHPEIKFAFKAVRTASLLVKDIQLNLAQPALTKDDRSPVTVADFASQALVGKLFQEQYPDVPLVAEENASILKTPEETLTLRKIVTFVRNLFPSTTEQQVCNWIDQGTASPGSKYWTLDPIDGTKGFLRGDQYVVALAMVENGEAQIGLLGCPNLAQDGSPDFSGSGSIVIAQKGQGCWILPMQGEGIPQRLQVSSQADITQARLLRSFEAAHTNVSQVDQFAEKLSITAEPLRMDSQAKYVMLASGQGEMLLRLLSPGRKDYREKVWDQAAGSIILEEAGGRITDLDGKKLDFTQGRTLAANRGVFASNGLLHGRALEMIKNLGI